MRFYLAAQRISGDHGAAVDREDRAGGPRLRQLLAKASALLRWVVTTAVHVPIEDIAPNEVALAWAEHRHTPLIAEFSEIARQG